MYIIAFYTDDGAPKTGLSPTIRIRKVSDNSLLVTDAAMAELGDGWYKYDYGAYDEELDYAVRCDAGSSLTTADRYKYAGNESFIDDINTKLSNEHGYGSWGFADGTAGINAKLDRILGLTQENYYVDNTVFNSGGMMTSSRIRTYSNPASIGTANDVIATYTMTATYNGSNEMQSYKVEKV